MSPAPNIIFINPSVSKAERELITGLKLGEVSAFNQLYNMYASNLLGVLTQIVKQKETAEDLLQDCFTKISQNISSYDPNKSRLFTWILNIARNGAIDHIRKRSSQNQKYTYELESVCNEIENCFTQSINTDTIGMKKIVASLSPKQNKIVDLIYFQGYTHTEVAQELEIPLGSVKTSLRNAVVKLRRIYCATQNWAA